MAFNVPKNSFVKNEVLSNVKEGGGQLVMFAHDNFTLVANMMIGIKKAADSVLEYPEVRSQDFNIVSKFYIIPWAILHDSEKTSRFSNCRFIDYSPQVFYSIRRIYRIKTQEYTRALGPQQLLAAYRGNFMGFTEFASTGKSGSFFYYSYDSKFVLKTISEDEFKFLNRILPNYYEHLKKHNDTLLPRFYGCHRIIFNSSGIGQSKEFKFVIMNNVFCDGQRIQRRYDLKGSIVGRQVLKNPDDLMYFNTKYSDPTIARKELDLKNEGNLFNLEIDQKEKLMERIKNDCEFFEQNNINDYSLLIGVHKHELRESSETIAPILRSSSNFSNMVLCI